MALWKARALSPEQKVQIVEEESEAKNLQSAEEECEAKTLPTEESGSFLGLGDVSMSLVYSSVLSVPVSLSPFILHSLHSFENCVCLCLILCTIHASEGICICDPVKTYG